MGCQKITSSVLVSYVRSDLKRAQDLEIARDLQ